MGSFQKVHMCLLLTTISALTASGQRNRYNYNNNYNNQNSGYRGSSVCDDKDNPCEEGRPIDIPCPAQFSGNAEDEMDQTYFNERSVSYQTAPCALRIERAHPD